MYIFKVMSMGVLVLLILMTELPVNLLFANQGSGLKEADVLGPLPLPYF